MKKLEASGSPRLGHGRPGLLTVLLAVFIVSAVVLPRFELKALFSSSSASISKESPATSGLPTAQSSCRIDGDGAVVATPREERPFLFDTASMPAEEQVCSHCPGIFAKEILCCGMCVFEHRKCDTFYPGAKKTESLLDLYGQQGFRFGDLSPCELFQRIRGRTLYFLGDSQTWHFFYSAECFLREFAKGVQRTYLVPNARRRKEVVTVNYPFNVPGICMELEAGTRVCALRVDSAENMARVVLPKFKELVPGFKDHIAIFNTGLHYGRGYAQMDAGMKILADAIAADRANLPQMIWMDTPVQHFDAPLGEFPNGKMPYTCAPLKGWYDGNPTLLAGGNYNAVAAKYLARFDGHLATWNASVALWDSHKPGECTHWCSPSAYHVWLYLLNGVLRDKRLGNPVEVSLKKRGKS